MARWLPGPRLGREDGPVPLPPRLARFNRLVTNRVLGPAAPYVPGFGVVVHRGRKSGRVYRTPVNVFRRPGGFVIALTYGGGDWVDNVLAAGEAQIRTRGHSHHVANPRVVTDPARAAVPAAVRAVFGRIHVDDFLHVDDAGQPGS